MLPEPSNRVMFRRIWALSWPMVVYNVLEMTVGFVDLLMVRPLGPAATAAIGVSRQVTFLVEAAAIAISTGVITLVSQGVGARSLGQVENVIRQSVLLVVLLGIPTSLFGFLLSRPLLVGLNASTETLVHADPYLHTYFCGVVFSWGVFVGTAIFRGSGDAGTPLKVALVVNVLNIVLNYVFIFGPGPLPAFDVPGAALGTVAARCCGMLIYVALLLRGTDHLRLRRLETAPSQQTTRPWFDWTLVGRMLRIGFPMAMAGVLRNSSRLVFLAIVGASAFGVPFHAAVGVGLQVRLVSILPALGFQVATATLVGQAIGRGAFEEAEALGRRSVQLLAPVTIVVVGTIMVFAEPLSALLIESPEMTWLGARVLRWFALAQFFSALSIGTQGALMGGGDTGPAMRYTLVTQWLVMVPLAVLLREWIPDGPLAAWALAPAISFVLMQKRFRSGKWKSIHA